MLGADADVFRARYGILPDGNAPADPQDEFTHKNLLYTARSIDDVASMTGRSVGRGRRCTANGAWPADRATGDASAAAPRRQGPDRVERSDDRGVCAGRAHARGAEGYMQDAQRAARFVREHLWQPSSRTLLRRYRDGSSGVEAYAEDYAYLIFGLLELFQADGDRGVAGVGAHAAGAAGRAVLGSERRWLVQHDRQGRISPAAAQRGLRRRRAGGELGQRHESADAVASRPREFLREDRTDARQCFASRAGAIRKGRTDDAGGALRRIMPARPSS